MEQRRTNAGFVRSQGGFVLAYLKGLLDDKSAGALAGKVIIDHLVKTKRIGHSAFAESYVRSMSEPEAERIYEEIASDNWQ